MLMLVFFLWNVVKKTLLLFLQAVLQHVLHGLQDPILASEAATALQSICTKCRDQMAQHFTGASNSMAAEVVEKKKFLWT